MSGQRVEIGAFLTSAVITDSLTTPKFDITKNPKVQPAGSIAWDINSNLPYYSNGSQWVSFSVGSGLSKAFSLALGSPLSVLPSTPTVLAQWSTSSDPSFFTIPEFNTSTGVYTAASPQTLTINASVSWSGGISNLGDRYLQLMFYKYSTGITYTSKENVRQAEPKINVNTVQDLSGSFKLSTGDQVWVQVMHTAATSLTISSGTDTTVNGMKMPQN